MKYELANIPSYGVLPSFSIGVFPVTNAEYREFLAQAGSETKLQVPKYWDDPKFNQPSQPIVGVSWHDALDFCAWAGLELPTSEEWELAAGPIPDNPLDYGWFWENSDGRLHTIGEKPPNSLGLYDMWGNVWEWTTEAAGSSRGLRGSGWHYDATGLRSANRFHLGPASQHDVVGFRCSSHQSRVPEFLISEPSDRWLRIFEE